MQVFMKETRQVIPFEWAEEQGNTYSPENAAMETKVMGNKCEKRNGMESN